MVKTNVDFKSILDTLKRDVKVEFGKTDELNPVILRLNSYLLKESPTERIPLLIGGTAVAKSALVKQIAKLNGFRLVDLRTAFMSRLDLEGLSEVMRSRTGKAFSYNAPMSEMIQCTDAFVDFAKDSLKILKEELENNPEDKALINVVKKFEEYAKPPVLFLDEITRTEASVRQALTKIINEKSFMGYKMTYAKILSATNFPLGLSDDLRDLYLTAEVDDVAFLDRFETIPIHHLSVKDSWLVWATEKVGDRQNIHPIILDYLELNEEDYYNTTGLEEMATKDIDLVSTVSFPNYRTWEMVSNYLYNLGDEPVNRHIIAGLIGEQCKNKFMRFIQVKGLKQERVPAIDEFDIVIEEALKYNVPTMLIGPSGIGKTTRIMNVAKKMNYKVLAINLAELDRTDVMGPPAKVDIITHIAGEMSGIKDETKESIKKVLYDKGLNDKMTVRAPKLQVAKEFHETLKQGKPIVLFIDELNRVSNPALMSAVFEAISDHRIFGISFHPSMVRVISACNIGENFQDTQDLDPAFIARFCVYKRMKYNKSDILSIRRYIKENYSPIISFYIDSLSDADLSETLSAVESRVLEQSTSSTRAFDDLNNFIVNNDNPMLTKQVLFKTHEEESKLSRAFRSKGSSLSEIFSQVSKSIDESSVAYYKGTVSLNGLEVTMSDVIGLFKLNYLEEPEKIGLLSLVHEVDRKIKETRTEIFSYFLGVKEAERFSEFYNTVSGTVLEVIEISDLVDETKIEPFIKRKMAMVVLPQDKVELASSLMEEVAKEWSRKYNPSRTTKLVTSILEELPSIEARTHLINLTLEKPILREMFVVAENTDLEKMKSLYGIKGDLLVSRVSRTRRVFA